MKSILFSITLVAMTSSVFAQEPATSAVALANTTKAEFRGLNIGAALPMADIKLKTTEGDGISLNEAKTQNGLLVMFSCNTCPFVVKSQPRTLEVMKMVKEMGIGMIVLNSNEAQRGAADSYAAMAEYAKKQHYMAPYAVDEKSAMADAFGATRTPEVFLFDAKGTLIYKGAMEDNPSDPASSKEMYLAAALKSMKTGGKINPAETKSIGCSIKRL